MHFKLLSYERMLSMHKRHQMVYHFQCVDCGLCLFEAKEHDCDPRKGQNDANGVRCAVFPEFKADVVLKADRPCQVLLPNGKLVLLTANAEGALEIRLKDVYPVSSLLVVGDINIVDNDVDPAPAVPMKPTQHEHMRLANYLSIHSEPWTSDVSVWGHWRPKTTRERNP